MITYQDLAVTNISVCGHPFSILLSVRIQSFNANRPGLWQKNLSLTLLDLTDMVGVVCFYNRPRQCLGRPFDHDPS
jgi:hypothetical protein